MLLIKKFVSVAVIAMVLTLFPTNQSLALNSSSSGGEGIGISVRNRHLIFNSFIPELTNERVSLFILNPPEPEREAVLALLGMAIKSNAIDYLMIQAPREVLVEIAKAGLRVIALAYAPDISTIAEFGLDRAREKVVDWLVKNELRVGSGNLDLSYPTYDGERLSVNLPFVLTHNPKDGRIEIAIYSAKEIKPPISQGSITGSSVRTGNFWNMQEWIQQGKTTLPPFTVRISGRVEEQGQFGGYFWKERPTINIDFQSPVPKIEFKEISFLGRQLLPLNERIVAARNALEIITNTASAAGNRISGAAQSVWERIRSSMLNLARFGGASVSSLFFSPGNDKATVVSLQDETITFQERAQKEASNNIREIEELRKNVEELERELEVARQTTRESQRVAGVRVRTAEEINQVEINSAQIEDLTRIVHIGPARAREIIGLRPFLSLDDLARVPGIGAKIIEDIKKQGLAYVKPPRVEEEKDINEEEVEKEVNVPTTNPCLSGRVNINSAPLADLVFLQGIGPAIGQRIIDHRRLSSFRSLDELKLVSGIGPRTLERIREQGCAYVKNESPTTPSRLLPLHSGINHPQNQEARIILNSNNFSFHWSIGESSPVTQPLIIKNDGEVPLVWSAEPKEWILLSKNSGILPPKESDSLTLNIDPTKLEAGPHSVKLLIASNDKNSPAEIRVSITILPPPQTAQGVVISEIKINEKEFIELYNPTSKDILMDEWHLAYYSSEREWNNPHKNRKFPKDSVLLANSYLLIGVYGYPKNGNPEPDWELLTAAGSPHKSGRLANSNGSLAIFNCDPEGKEIEKINECLIDAVGWGETIVKRGLASIAPGRDKSIARRKKSDGEYIDNKNNSTDFSVGMPTPLSSKTERDDLISPNQITDLTVKCENGKAVLKWTAPRDSDSRRNVLSYEIRYKKGGLERWEDGIIAQNPPAVSATETNESFTIESLEQNTTYEFGIITLDSKNRSPVSNIVSCVTEKRKNLEKPIVRKFVSGEWESNQIQHPILIDDQGSVYFSGEITINGIFRRGFFAFDRLGKLKWHLDGINGRFSNLILLPDNNIFMTFEEMGTLYQEFVMMKINREGQTEWTREIKNIFPLGHLPTPKHGKVYLFLSSSDGQNRKLAAIDLSNGEIGWEYELSGNLLDDIPPTINQDGLIYLSLNHALYSIDQNGAVRWRKTFPFFPSGERNRTWPSAPVINENILYLFVSGESESMVGKCDHIYGFDLNEQGKKLWKTDCLRLLRGSPIVNQNGDVFVFNFISPVHRFVTIFGYDREGRPLSGWPHSILFAGLLESMIVDGDNNLYGLFDGSILRSFDVGGNKRWTISGFEFRRNSHISIDQEGNLYLGGNKYLYKIEN